MLITHYDPFQIVRHPDGPAEGYRQHVGHRIVRTALQFEQRAQPVFRPMRCVRSRLNTEAESVDDTVAASSIDIGRVSPMSSRVHSDR